MKFKKFNSWKEVFNAMFVANSLTLETFEEIHNITDLICEGEHWLNGEEMFGLYNSNNSIEIDYENIDKVNPDQWILPIIQGNRKFELCTCSAIDPEDCWYVD